MMVPWRKHGVPGYLNDDGRWFPMIAGGQDPPPDDDDEGEEDDTPPPSDIKDPAAKIAAMEDQINRLMRKLKQGGRTVAERDKIIKQYEDERKTEQEKTEERLTASDRRVAELEALVNEKDVEILVLSHDKLAGLPGRRRKMIMATLLRELRVDEDGESNLGELLDDMEKDDPGIFKLVAADDDADADANGQVLVKTGTKPDKNKSSETADSEQLRARFPALRR
jgi:hypothetical protein